MAVKHLGKKGMFLTFISIALIAAAIIIFTPSDINLRKDLSVIKTRVSNVDEYVLDLENVYLERTLQATGRNTIKALIGRVENIGFFSDKTQFENTFSEVLLCGQVGGIIADCTGGTPIGDLIDLDYMDPNIMVGNTYNDWLTKIKTVAQSTFNVDTTISTINVADIQIYQIKPWFVNVDADISFTVSTVEGTALWTKDIVINTEINVEGFDDPYYLTKTGGSYVNKINKTDTQLDEWNVITVNDFITGGNYAHFPNSDAPDFLQRFYEDVSASSCCGIESFVNPAKVSDWDTAYVDHSYWSSSYPCPNNNLYTLNGLNSKFKLDLQHVIMYNLFSAADLKCPPT